MPNHVSPGAKVVILNQDPVAHTVTLAAAGIDVSVEGVAYGYFTAPATPGHYLVTCDYHADMTATLVVQ
jgi:plastocyanin